MLIEDYHKAINGHKDYEESRPRLSPKGEEVIFLLDGIKQLVYVTKEMIKRDAKKPEDEQEYKIARKIWNLKEKIPVMKEKL